jgi:hypothetical protein
MNTINTLNIITGEKIQKLCDIYLGNDCDYNANKLIKKDIKKLYTLNITSEYNNPKTVFCYSHNIKLLSKKIHLFTNEFILVSHNSDDEIKETPEVLHILNNSKLLKWFGQNVCFKHPKLYMVPIGIANSSWAHGDLTVFNIEPVSFNMSKKPNFIFFNFSISTNTTKRNICYESLKNYLIWTPNMKFHEYIPNLSSYQFCICPEGNGVDTHRLWESLYLKVVPIVINSPFTQILLEYNVPLLVVDKWSDIQDKNIISDKLIYSKYNFDDILFQKLITFTPDYISNSEYHKKNTES